MREREREKKKNPKNKRKKPAWALLILPTLPRCSEIRMSLEATGRLQSHRGGQSPLEKASVLTPWSRLHRGAIPARARPWAHAPRRARM